MRHAVRLLVIMLALSAVTAACGSDDDNDSPALQDTTPTTASPSAYPTSASTTAAAAAAAPSEIKIVDFAFQPKTLPVKVGTTLKVSNTGSATHTFTADDKSFDTGRLSPGQSGTVNVSKAGTIKFHCEIHSSMTGELQASA